MSDTPTSATTPQRRYRYAEPDDAPVLAAIKCRGWHAAYTGLLDERILATVTPDRMTDPWRRQLEAGDDGTTTIVAMQANPAPADPDPSDAAGDETAEQVVGYVIAGPDRLDPERGEIYAIYVEPELRGTGIGGVLLTQGLRVLRRSGHERARLWVLEGNDPAIGFYQQQGWRIDGASQSLPTSFDGVTIDELSMVTTIESLDVLAANREEWDGQADWYAEGGDRAWRQTPQWGVFGIPEEQVGMLPDVADRDVVELGCGTGYVSAWCLRAGARSAVGIDNSRAQLATAARLADEHDLLLPLVWGDAQHTPFRDASFDVAISEYGAAIWCDPRIWIPEAARLLRPGGTLVFLGNSVLSMLAVPDFVDGTIAPRLLRPQRGMHHFTWPDDDSSEYHVSHGEMIRILRGAGFEIVDLLELYAEEDASTNYSSITAEWASTWPVEEVWVARRLG